MHSCECLEPYEHNEAVWVCECNNNKKRDDEKMKLSLSMLDNFLKENAGARIERSKKEVKN